MDTSTQQTTCANCNITGLPVLPALYAVMPTSLKPSLPKDISGVGVAEVALDPAQYGYGLRIVRAGYIYIFYEKGARGTNYWERYTVNGDGCMTIQPSAQLSLPPQEKLSCSTKGHLVARTQYLVIPQPEVCGTVWLAYSEHHWTKATFDRYASDKGLRERRMQAIEPAAWIKSGHTQTNAVEATKDAFQHILEYHPLLNVKAAFAQGATGSISNDESGTYSELQLLRQATRFPVSPRNEGDAVNVTQLIKQMQVTGKRPDGKSHPPVLLALNDAVGITHELNGFCGDLVGRLKKYQDERALEIAALKGIRGVKQAIVSSAQARAAESQRVIMSEAHFNDMMRVKPHPLGWPADVRYEKLTDTEEYGFNKVEVFPSGQAERSKKAVDDAEISSWDKYAAKLERDSKGKYAIDVFEENFDKLQANVSKTLDARTVQLIKWLEADRFIDTLEDYDPADPVDGVELEDVIGDAVLGMNATVSGAKRLQQWANEGRVGNKANLLYRALSQNQKEHGDEINALLEHAKANREVSYTREAFAAVMARIKDAQKLADLYKKSATLLNNNTKALSTAGTSAFKVPLRAARTGGLDKLVITTGDAFFKAFKIDKAANFVGEKLLQHLFSIRALVDPADSKALIEANHGEWIRRQQAKFKSQGQMNRNRAKAWGLQQMAQREAEFRRSQPQAVTEAWKKFQTAKPSDGVLAIRDIRLALVVGLIEGVNFGKLVYLYNGDKRSMWLLGASGMSVGAALIDIAATPVKSVFGSDAISHQKLKLAGGVLSAGASAIGAWYDFTDAATAKERGQTSLQYLYDLKGFLGGSSAITTGLTTYSYAAPFITRVTGRAAVAEAAEVLSVRAAAMIGTRIIFMSAGAWITAVVFAVQLIIWAVNDNELQTWMSLTPFGKARKTPNGYRDAEKMKEALAAAWAEVS